MDQSHRTELLRIARQAVEDELCGRHAPIPARLTFPPDTGGAFVTLHHGARLRGCMGTFSPKQTLDHTIEYVARLSANDVRFRSHPVTLDELPHVTIEISVLSERQRAEKPSEIRIGEHGIVIRRGDASGCFLPQVAVQNQWDVTTFLEQCCATKAKLPADAWKDAGTELYLFTAEVFAE